MFLARPLNDLHYWNEGGVIFYEIVPRGERYALAALPALVYVSYRLSLQVYFNIVILKAQLCPALP